MKRCPKCGMVKARTEFHRHSKRADHIQVYCKACRRSIDREYYVRTQQGSNPKRQESRREYDHGRRQWMRSLKMRPCADCRRSYPPQVMQWDHLPGTVKLGNISTDFRHRSRDEILAEISKCELVCVNCHALRTCRRSGLIPAVQEWALPYAMSH